MKKFLIMLFVKTHISLYRLTGGRVGAKLAGLDHLLLTTTGRKSGKRRTIPIACKRQHNALLVVASNNGQDRHPAWYLNLQANPEVEVQWGREKRATRARTATPEERATLWPELTTYNPMFARYEKRTSREIPVVILNW